MPLPAVPELPAFVAIPAAAAFVARLKAFRKKVGGSLSHESDLEGQGV